MEVPGLILFIIIVEVNGNGYTLWAAHANRDGDNFQIIASFLLFLVLGNLAVHEMK